MKKELFWIWLFMSAGVWLAELTITGRHWDHAAQATFWIGMTCAWVAFKLRHYETI